MSSSIIPQLVRKDFLLMRKAILIFCLVCAASLVAISLMFGNIPNWVFFNLGFTLLVVPACSCGIFLVMKTIVMEKEKSTQSFIMSLPVTVKEFTQAKLLVNLPVFFLLWLLVSGVAFYFCFGLGVFPPGTVPFITMIFLGIFVAYTSILCTSLLFQSVAVTILTVMTSELGTAAYLWIVAYLEPIKTHVYGPQMVWNSTAVTIIAAQIFIAVAVLLMTWYVQNKKRDFI